MWIYKLLNIFVKNFLFCLIGISVFLITVFSSWFVWDMIGDVSLSFHGWLALIIGSFFIFIVGSFLMALSFYSHRSGHDQDVHEDSSFNDRF